MDAFETSIGYRSLFPSLRPPDKKTFKLISEEERLQLARQSFDASLAETLRSTGEWHWMLPIHEVVEGIAETLCIEEETYERLRRALLEHYDNQYRMPTTQEYRAYLVENHPTLLEPRVTASCHSDDFLAEAKNVDVTLWFTQATDEELQALRDERYGGDYTAYSVAEFIASDNPQVQAIFDHNAMLSESVELRGFECYVNEEEVEAWIVRHRPHLAPR
jgi:hypothetical protein